MVQPSTVHGLLYTKLILFKAQIFNGLLVSIISRIRHFAGTLNYSIDDFVEKNSDKIPKHLSSGLYQSKLAIVQNLFPEGNKKKSFSLIFSLPISLFNFLVCYIFLFIQQETPSELQRNQQTVVQSFVRLCKIFYQK